MYLFFFKNSRLPTTGTGTKKPVVKAPKTVTPLNTSQLKKDCFLHQTLDLKVLVEALGNQSVNSYEYQNNDHSITLRSISNSYQNFVEQTQCH